VRVDHYLRCSGVLFAFVAWEAGSAAAQEYSGKLQGRIKAVSGAALPSAQVAIPGTAYGASADTNGYYFINNLPVGTYSVRGQLIGFAPAQVRGVRILGGQTTDLDIVLQEAAIMVTGVTVTVAVNPIVPRDQVTTKTIVSGELVRDLPMDNLRDIVTLQPGVVLTGGAGGLQDGFSIRGSRPGEAQIYIDGAPVRPVASASLTFAPAAGNLTERQMPQIGTNALEEVTVTTGALAASQGNAQAGVVSYTTRAGGDRLSGSFDYETDEPFGNAVSQGLNRFAGAVGGPLPGVPRLRFFVSGVLQGERSSGVGSRLNAGWGWDKVPTFVNGGLDTTVNWSEGDGGDVRSVAIPRFVQVTGVCGTLGSDATTAARDIRNNYGFDCQGGRLPMNWQTDTQLQGKLLYSYGLGSGVSLTALANGKQRRFWPGAAILNPALFQGQHGWSRAAILNLSHQVFREADRALGFNLTASWQEDNLLAGLLDPAYEVSSRFPALGIELSTVRFAGLDAIPYPVTDELVLLWLAGRGGSVPYSGRDDLRPVQEFRLNPMAMAGGEWFTQGVDGDGQMHRERRYTTQLTADWQIDRFNRLTLGGEGHWTTVAHWETGSVLLSSFAWLFRESPTTYALYGSDRLDLGDLVLEVGLRWDYFHTHARFPKVPGELYYAPAVDSTLDSMAVGYARATYPGVGHSAWSPRVRVSFPVTEWTDLRLSYGKQVQQPDLYFTFWNNDVTFGQTILYEFGARHAFSRGTVLDVAFYNKDIRSEISLRKVKYDDPQNPGAPIFPFVFLNLDYGYVRGADVKLDLRLGGGFAGSAGYGYQTSRSTGSDPLSVARQTITQVTVDSIGPAQAVNVTNFDRTHNVLATLAWAVSDGSAAARLFGGALRNVGLFATARYQSGLPYTRLDRGGDRVGAFNDSRLPPLRNVDARLTKGFSLGRVDATAYLDARNLLNFRNTINVFRETGNVSYSLDRETNIDNEVLQLRGEAGTSDVDVGNCAESPLNPVNCVALNRAEARYGDGDGLFTEVEQRRAFGAWYDMVSGAQWFYGPPRRIRFGVQLSF